MKLIPSEDRYTVDQGGLNNPAFTNGDEVDGGTMGDPMVNSPAVLNVVALNGGPVKGITRLDVESGELPNGMGINKKKKKNGNNNRPAFLEESSFDSFKQIFVPFMLANIGSMMAGVILGRVTEWTVFKDIRELIIVIPAIIGLKGDVEMAMASRLSTKANLGLMDDRKEKWSMIFGNMFTVQCQASTVGTLAPIIAILLSFFSHGISSFTPSHVLILFAATVSTANIANLILGSTMCWVILACRNYSINPDNIATPIAASLGDACTMALLAAFSYTYYEWLPIWLTSVILAVQLLATPIWGILASRNKYTKNVIKTGWGPILGSMIIANGGGAIMEIAMERFDKISFLQPLVNGIAGDLVCIQSSRMATHLHYIGKKKNLPDTDPHACPFPFFNFFGKSVHRKVARVLLFITVPSHLIFFLVVNFLEKQYTLTIAMLICYLSTNFALVATILYFGYCMVQLTWKWGGNPDNWPIPLLTGIADFMGSGFLAICFLLLAALYDPNAILKSVGQLATTPLIPTMNFTQSFLTTGSTIAKL